MALNGIDDTLHLMLACIDEALREDEAPTCVVATTIGEPVIATCCECAGGANGELWGSFRRLYHGDRNNGNETRARKPCAPAIWWAQYQITLARCFPTVDEHGEVPDPQDRSAAAQELHADIATIQRALHCCTITEEPPYIEQSTVTTDPAGGCSRLTVMVRIPVSINRALNTRPEA